MKWSDSCQNEQQIKLRCGENSLLLQLWLNWWRQNQSSQSELLACRSALSESQPQNLSSLASGSGSGSLACILHMSTHAARTSGDSLQQNIWTDAAVIGPRPPTLMQSYISYSQRLVLIETLLKPTVSERRLPLPLSHCRTQV